MQNQKTRQLIFAGLMVVVGIVLYNVLSFSYPPGSNTIIKIGIGYLPLVLVSVTLGPKNGLYAAIAQDLLGFLIFNGNWGLFFPGFTLNAVLYGVLPGLIYHGKSKVQKTFLIINLVLLLSLIAMGVWGLFNVNTLVETLASGVSADVQIKAWVIYLIIVLGLLGVVSVIVFVYRKRQADDQTHRLIFTIIILQFLVAIFLTPLWISILTNGSVPILAQLPLRIVKTPFEIFLYIILLERIIKILGPKIKQMT